MSLINQMLRDLDKRRATNGKETNLPNDVRSLPPPKVSRLPVVLRLTVFIAVGGVAYYFLTAKTVAPLPDIVALSAPAPIDVLPPPELAAPAAPSPSAEPTTPAVVSPPPESAAALLSSTPAVETLTPPASIAVPSAALDVANNSAEKPLESAVSPTNSVTPPLPLVTESPKLATEINRPKTVEKATAKTAVKASPKVAAEVPTLASKNLPKETAQEKTAKNTATRSTGSITKSDAPLSPRERANAEYRRAISAVNQGRVPEASEGLRKALRADPLHSASRQLLVNLLLESQQSAEAMQTLRDGLANEPSKIVWAMSLARLEMDQGKPADALKTLENSLPAAANNANYYGFIGHVQQGLKRYREAIDSFQKATQLAPADGRWWLGLGLAMEEDGLSTEAKQAFTQARQTSNLSQELRTLLEQKLR